MPTISQQIQYKWRKKINTQIFGSVENNFFPDLNFIN